MFSYCQNYFLLLLDTKIFGLSGGSMDIWGKYSEYDKIHFRNYSQNK